MHIIASGLAVLSLVTAPYQVAQEHNELFNDAAQRLEYIACHAGYVEYVTSNWNEADTREYLLLLDDALQSNEELALEYKLARKPIGIKYDF